MQDSEASLGYETAVSEVTRPKVSVIIPCYNQARYLMESVSSALNSYSGPIEILIVDDGSTESKISEFLTAAQALSPAVQIISQKNQGLSGARNTGIRAATGEFIQLLDADDLIVPPKIDLQVAHFKVSRKLDVSISNFLLCDETRTHFIKHDEAIAHSDFSLSDFLFKWERGFAVPIHSALFRRDILNSNLFDTEVHAKEDWIFWCKLRSGGARMAYLNIHNAMYRQHDQSMRRSYVKMGKNWLKATLKIDAFVAEDEPRFYESAIDWFQSFYLSHPSYKAEISASQKEHDSSASFFLGKHLEAQYDETVAERLLAKLMQLPTENPLISVVVPVFNHFEFLIECLFSLGRQDKLPFEIICIDDASTDERSRKLLTFLKDKHPDLTIRLHQENRGISATQNEAVSLARSEFVAFVDCDDYLADGALSRVIEVLRENPTIDYLFTDRLDVDATGRTIRRADYGGYPAIRFKSTETIRDDLLDGMVASHLKVVRRSLYLSIGGSSDKFTGIQDWEFALKVADRAIFKYLPEPLYNHRLHAGSVTRSDSVSQFRKANIVRRMHLERWLRGPRGVDQDRLKVYKSASDGLPSLIDLRTEWRKGARCSFVMGRNVPIHVVNFLREFNSYFEEIVWSDPESYVALVGYTWGNILQRDEVTV